MCLLAQVGLAKNPVGPVFLLDLSAGQDNAFLEMLAPDWINSWRTTFA